MNARSSTTAPVTRPPALRSTTASPSRRPKITAGSTRGAKQGSTAICSRGMIVACSWAPPSAEAALRSCPASRRDMMVLRSGSVAATPPTVAPPVMQMQHNAEEFAAEMTQLCLGSRIGRLHRVISRRFELALAPTGLTPPQLEILAALTIAGGAMTPSALARILAVERSTMSRNLALMRDRGWIAPADLSRSGRTMAVTITAEGRAAFTAARQAWREAQDAVVEALGDGASTAVDGWLTGLGVP